MLLLLSVLGWLDLTAAQLTVSNIDDSGPGSFRDALQMSGWGDVITFAVTGTISNLSGEFVLMNDVQIIGPGTTNLTISGNNSNRLFTVWSGVTATISGLTLRNGRTSGGSPGSDPATPGGPGEPGAGIYNNGALTLSNCVIRNCTTGNGGDGYNNNNINSATGLPGSDGGRGGVGAGLYNLGTLTMLSCQVLGNITGNGRYGGVGGNQSAGSNGGGNGGNGGAGGDGGGIYNEGVLVLSGCSILGNFPGVGGAGGAGGQGFSYGAGLGGSGGPGGSGAGIYNRGDLSVNSSTFSACRGGNGGAGGPGGSALSTANIPGGAGGNGGYGGNGAGLVSETRFSINNCTFCANTCGFGGSGGSGGAGASQQTGQLATNGGIGGNGGAGGAGGGILTSNSCDLVACTFTANVTGSGGNGGTGGVGGSNGSHGGGNGGKGGNGGPGGSGGGVGSPTSASSVSLGNVLVAQNNAGIGGTFGAGGTGGTGIIFGSAGPNGSSGASGAGRDLGGSFVSLGHNLLGRNSGNSGLTNGVLADLVGSTTALNPLLASLNKNGGPSQTCALLAGSPAFDAGDDTLLLPPYTLNTDERGLPRKSGAHVDIGAYEVQVATAPFLLTSAVRNADRSFTLGFSNIQNGMITLLASTNITTASSNWLVLGAVPELSPGQYQFTDTSAKTNARLFYRLRSP